MKIFSLEYLLAKFSPYMHILFFRYELHAIQKEKLRRMETESDKSKEVNK